MQSPIHLRMCADASQAPQPKVAPPPSSPPIRAAAPPSSPIRASVTSSPPARPVASGSPPIKASGRFDWDDLESGFGQSAKPPSTKPTQPAASPPTLPFAILTQLQAAKPASSAPTAASKPSAPVKKPPPSAAAGPSKPPTGAKPGSSKTLAVSPSEPAKYRFTAEDAAAQAVNVIPADYHTKLADAAWKVRLEAAEAMVKWVEAEGGAEKVDSEVMIRFLGKTPGWGEKNFQVSNRHLAQFAPKLSLPGQVSAKLYQVMGLMAEKSPSFAKPAAALVIGPLSDRLGDLKLRKPAGDAMTAFVEKTSLAFVLAQGEIHGSPSSGFC